MGMKVKISKEQLNMLFLYLDKVYNTKHEQNYIMTLKEIIKSNIDIQKTNDEQLSMYLAEKQEERDFLAARLAFLRRDLTKNLGNSMKKKMKELEDNINILLEKEIYKKENKIKIENNKNYDKLDGLLNSLSKCNNEIFSYIARLTRTQDNLKNSPNLDLSKEENQFYQVVDDFNSIE